MIDWISVEERLPQREVEGPETIYPFVLVYHRWGDPMYEVGFYSTEDSTWYSGFGFDTVDEEVTHWASLSPPAGESGE